MKEIISDFEKIKDTESFKTHNDFIKLLLSQEKNNEVYNLHFQLIENTSNEIFHDRLCRAFAKRDKGAAQFLLGKALYENINDKSLADIIQILGLMKFYEIVPYIPRFLLSGNETVRCKCIIVLGWLGNEDELEILFSIIKSNEIDYLKGFSITAMRQIWYNHTNLKNRILHILNKVINSNESELVNAMTIICLQDILGVDLKVKEKYSGEIVGDIKKAKKNAIIMLSDYFY